MAALTLGDLANVQGLGIYSIADIIEALYRCADARGVDAPQSTRKSKTDSRKADIVPPDVRARFERLGRIPPDVRNCRLPPIPPGVTLSDLRLTGHAFRFFEQGGRLETPLALAELTIADLLNQTGLGVLTVIEISEALHRCAEPRRVEATLDEEVIGWLVPKGVLSRRQIVAKRFGLGGAEAHSLAGIGKSYGYTRERIRQLCSPPSAPPSSLLRRYRTVVEAVRSLLPAPAAELENRLVRQGLLESGTKLKAILRVAQLLNREAGFVLEGEGPNCLATPPLTDADVRMREFLMKLSQASPVMQVEHLCRRWNASGRPPLEVAAVERMIKSMSRLHWLDQASGWFWLDRRGTSLRRRIEKALGAANRLTFAELKAAVWRGPRTKNWRRPPGAVFRELCRQLPECRVQRNVVWATDPARGLERMGGAEKKLVKFLKLQGGACHLAELRKFSDSQSIKEGMLWQLLHGSAALKRYGECRYGVPGL